MKPEGGAQQVTPEVATDKNLMPSVVARQQRLHFSSTSQRPTSNSGSRNPADDDPISTSFLLRSAQTVCSSGASQQQMRQEFDQDGLILPRRVPHHPTSVAQPIIRDLNRELKFNQTRGKDVLDRKSELKKALEKLGESRKRKELEQERLNRRTSLELRLEERAERLAKETDLQADESPSAPARGLSIRSTDR